MHFLFSTSEEPIEGATPYLHEMLTSSTQIVISESDDLPRQICAGCVERLYSAFTFKCMCEQSDARLRARLSGVDRPLPARSLFLAMDKSCQTDVQFLQVHNCPHCQKKFKSLPGLTSHLKHHTERDNLTACGGCRGLFGGAEGLAAHCSSGTCPPPKRKHRAKEETTHCRDCNKSFMNNKCYRAHTCTKWEQLLEAGIKEELPASPSAPSPSAPFSPAPSDGELSEGVKREFEDSDYEPLTHTKMRQTINSGSTRIFKKVTSDMEKYPCSLCPRVLSSEVQLQVHTAKHSGQIIPFCCPVCKRNFTRHSHLKRHLAIHSPSRRLQCPQCDKTFTRQEQLHRHLCAHAGGQLYQCELCPRCFPLPELLARHHATVHAGLEPTQASCGVCRRSFSSQRCLERHSRVHNPVLVLPCPQCALTFPSRRLLRKHKTSAHRPAPARPFLCSQCGGSFTRQSDLATHMRRHTGEKPFACHYCPKRFTRLTDLTIHERYHTEDKAHVCAVCGKSFHRQYNLKVHLRIHSGERPYSCSHCGKGFAQSNDLKSHVRRHTGERYGCELCKEVFVQAYHLNKHKRSVHGLEVVVHNRRVAKHPGQGPLRIPRAQHRASRAQLAQTMAALLAPLPTPPPPPS